MLQSSKNSDAAGNAGDRLVVAGARTGGVQKLSLGVVDIFEVRIVGDGLDARLLRQDFIVARHDGDGAQVEALREVHGADRHCAFLSSSCPSSFCALRSAARTASTARTTSASERTKIPIPLQTVHIEVRPADRRASFAFGFVDHLLSWQRLSDRIG